MKLPGKCFIPLHAGLHCLFGFLLPFAKGFIWNVSLSAVLVERFMGRKEISNFLCIKKRGRDILFSEEGKPKGVCPKHSFSLEDVLEKFRQDDAENAS